MSIGRLLKKIAPVALSVFAGPAIGQGLGALFGAQGAMNPFLTRALTGAGQVLEGKTESGLYKMFKTAPLIGPVNILNRRLANAGASLVE